jgi:hypothetical protein
VRALCSSGSTAPAIRIARATRSCPPSPHRSTTISQRSSSHSSTSIGPPGSTGNFDRWTTHRPTRAAELRLVTQVFQEEVRDAYEISLRRYRDALEAIYAAVDPTPEQREAIRSIVIEHVKHTRLEATPTRRRAAMREVYDMLDDERKARLLDYLLERVVPNG